MKTYINQHKKIVILLAAQAALLVFLVWQLTGKGQEYPLQITPVSGTEEAGGTVDYISQKIPLKTGSYRVVVDYEASSDLTNAIDVVSESAGYGVLKTNTTPLYAGESRTSYLFWLNGSAEDVQVKITFGGEGTLAVLGGRLLRTNHMERQRLLWALVFLAFLDVLLYVLPKWNRMERSRKQESGMTAVLLGGIILGVSLPLFTDYLLTGADMTFHLLRIEGIKDGLVAGQFPVRIQPNWLQGHGYAVGIFYCDLFLYLPAFLRLMGLTVQAAYQCYKFSVNAATCLIAWYSFKKMSGSNRIGIFGSFLYTFYLVRVVYIYGVDGVGQYSAMTFLPLVAYGFYRIFTKDQKKPEEKYSFIPLALGVSGVLCSHVLSFEILLFFILLLCIVGVRRLLQKEVLLQLVRAAAVTILLNLWYLVPFLEYMFSTDLAVTKGGAAYKQIQTWGMYIPQLFEPFPKGGQYGAHPAESGMVGETGYGIGLGLALGLLLVLFLLTVVRKPLEKAAGEDGKLCGLTGKAGKTALGFGILSLWMATIYFPWDRLAKCGGILRQLIATLQFPYRMLTFSGVFLIMACCFAIQDLKRLKDTGKLKPVFLYGAVLAVGAGQLLTTAYFHNTTFTGSSGFFRLYDETAMGNSYISGGEYVLLGTDTGKLTYKAPVCSERIALNSYEKRGCYVRLDCDCGAYGQPAELPQEYQGGYEQRQYIELPLLYYKGYRAKECGGGILPVVCGENNVVRVLVPSGFQGIIEVDFAGFWYWRAAEVISLVMAVRLICLSVGKIYPERKNKM